jgi:hypothetical protein
MEPTERFKMKSLLAGIAALLLGTGAASAEVKSERGFDCGRVDGGFSIEKTTKDATLMFEVNFSDNRERHLPSEEIVIRYNMRTDKLWINGKQCELGKWD